MSRNLDQTTCYYCEYPVVPLEWPRPITIDDCGGENTQWAADLFEEFRGMLVAKAECPVCLAKYLAWVDESRRKHSRRCFTTDEPIMDLSFRSTFNDEAGADDLPVYTVKRLWVRDSVVREVPKIDKKAWELP